jgi:hypothetical protein
LLRGARNDTVQQLLKHPLRECLAEHLTKVAVERAKDLPNENLLRYWEREIKAFEMGIARAQRKQGKRR